MTNSRRFSLIVVVFFLAFAIRAFTLRVWPPDLAEAEHKKDAQVIRQLNEECLHAHDVADVGTLDRIEDSDFTLSGGFGVIRKTEQLDHVRERPKGKTEVIHRKIDPQQFRFYGDVALVTETDRPTTAEGTFAFQSTEVWIRRDGSWKLLHLHYSRLEEK